VIVKLSLWWSTLGQVAFINALAYKLFEEKASENRASLT